MIPQDKITQQWFQKKRPYTDLDDYDRYLINLTQDVFNVLKENPFPLENFKLNTDQNKELAYILAGYFEDFMSEIGIWESLRNYHKELYDTPLPVLVGKEDEYDETYINAADLQFLIWNFYARLYPGYAMTPQFEYFYLLSESVFNILDEEVDKGIATGFFESYLPVNEKDNFYDIKDKLTWFAMESYITGFEYRFKLGQQFLQEQKKHNDPNYLRLVHNYIQEDLLFKTPSQWSAITAIDWLSEISTSEPKIKEQLLNLKKRNSGKFTYLGENDKHYRFQHIYNKKEYEVLKRSFYQQGAASDFNTSNIYHANFVQWNEDWYLTGYIFDTGEKTDSKSVKEYIENGDENLYAFDAEYRQKVKNRNENLEKAFLTVFNDNLVFFDSGVELQEGISRFLAQYNKEYESKPIDDQEELPERFKNLKDVALYFNKETGYEIAERIKEFIDTCQKDEISDEEGMFLVKYTLYSNLSAQFILELNRRHELKKLPDALKSLFDLDRELEFYLRFYKPGYFQKLE